MNMFLPTPLPDLFNCFFLFPDSWYLFLPQSSEHGTTMVRLRYGQPPMLFPTFLRMYYYPNEHNFFLYSICFLSGIRVFSEFIFVKAGSKHISSWNHPLFIPPSWWIPPPPFSFKKRLDKGYRLNYTTFIFWIWWIQRNR